MRVAVLCERFYPVIGGTETQNQQLSEILMEHGVEIFIVTRRTSRSHRAFEYIGNLPVYRCPTLGKGGLSIFFSLIPMALLLIHKRHSFDIIHCHGLGLTGALGGLMGKVLEKKTIVKVVTVGELSGNILGKKKKNPYLVKLRNYFLKMADYMVCPANEILDEMISYNIPIKKMARITNGIDIDRFSPRPEKRKNKKYLLPNKIHATYCGNFRYLKGVDLLIEIWPTLLKDFPRLHLNLLGDDTEFKDSNRKKLETLVERFGIGNNVTFHGDVFNPEDYLNESDLFVFPGRIEGLAIAVLEAMACGLPIVVSQVGDGKPILEDQITALLFPVDDKDKCIEAIRKVLLDPVFAESLGRKAREHVVKYYSLDKIAHIYLSIYQGLCPASFSSQRTRQLISHKDPSSL